MKTPALQYTIRGIPPEVDRVLRERAKQRNSSVNQVVIEELSKATVGPVKYADFSDLVGTWTDDPEFDEAIAWQRQIHEDDWK